MTKEDFLVLAGEHYEEVNRLTDSPDLYDYEKALYKLMLKVGGEIMEKQLQDGSVTENRRKKKR